MLLLNIYDAIYRHEYSSLLRSSLNLRTKDSDTLDSFFGHSHQISLRIAVELFKTLSFSYTEYKNRLFIVSYEHLTHIFGSHQPFNCFNLGLTSRYHNTLTG